MITNKKALLGLSLVTIALLYCFWGPVLLHPDQYIFASGGDATKNYYTYLYYLKVDTGTHFTGMNYPYRDHVVFTDNQPLVAFISKWWQEHIAPVYPVGIGVLNSLMIWSLVPTVLLLYLLLRRSLLSPLAAAAAALAIAFLAPQHIRLGAHYALAYSFVIPLVWYLLVRMQESKKHRLAWLFTLTAASLVTGMVHPYYLAINALFLLSYAVVTFLYRRKSGLTLAIFSTLAALLPIVLFQVWLAYTDNVLDRPSTPNGFFGSRANMKSIFLPFTGSIRDFLHEHLFEITYSTTEALVYVGLVSTFCLLLSLIKVGRQIKRKKNRNLFTPTLPAPLQLSLAAGFLALLFALAIPLKFFPSTVLDYLPLVKQFRAIARFAWIFYYVFTVYTAFYFYRLFRLWRMRGATAKAYALLGFLFLFWGAEALEYYWLMTKNLRNQIGQDYLISQGNGYTDYLKTAGYTPSDFQAIVPLPYYSAGAERFDMHRGQSVDRSMQASLHTNLPITAFMMSRTSLTQSMQQIQLLSSDLVQKELLKVLPSKKPLLVVVTKDSLYAQEENLLLKGKKIFSNAEVSLYALPLDSLAKTAQEKEAAFFQNNKSQFFQTDELFLTQNRKDFFLENFTNLAGAAGMHDAGAAVIPRKGLPILVEPLPTANDSTLYEVSAWVNLKGAHEHASMFSIVKDQAGAEVLKQEVHSQTATEVVRSWVRISLELPLEPGQKMEVLIHGRGARVDHFMVRPISLNIYRYNQKGKLLKNNYLLQD